MLIERYLQPEEASAPDEHLPALAPALVEVCFGVPAALAEDFYALHQTLELTIGARAETGYLFTLANDEARPVCVVRCRHLPPHLLAKAVPVPVLSAGREAAFRVHATLTMKNGSGQRRPVRHDNSKARTAWLERHAAAGGFRVDRRRAFDLQAVDRAQGAAVLDRRYGLFRAAGGDRRGAVLPHHGNRPWAWARLGFRPAPDPAGLIPAGLGFPPFSSRPPDGAVLRCPRLAATLWMTGNSPSFSTGR